jgi:hypothetical protein
MPVLVAGCIRINLAALFVGIRTRRAVIEGAPLTTHPRTTSLTVSTCPRQRRTTVGSTNFLLQSGVKGAALKVRTVTINTTTIQVPSFKGRLLVTSPLITPQRITYALVHNILFTLKRRGVPI